MLPGAPLPLAAPDLSSTAGVDRLQLRNVLGDELFALANDLPAAVVP